MNNLTISRDHRGNIVTVRRDGNKIRLEDGTISITKKDLEDIELTTDLTDLKLVVEHSINQDDEHGIRLVPGIVISIEATDLSVDLLYLPVSNEKCIDCFSRSILALQFIRTLAQKLSDEGILADEEAHWEQDVIGHKLTLVLSRSSFRDMFLRLDQFIESLANVFPKLQTGIDEMIFEAVTETIYSIKANFLQGSELEQLPV